MRLSLSVRIAEGFMSKERATMDLDAVCHLARQAGYEAICMRASQIGVHSTARAVAEAVATLERHEMPVSMVTGDFATVYNDQGGPDSLRKITPYLDLAQSLKAKLVRVAVKRESDVAHAQRAADEAAERDLTLVHQCHTLSLFETVDSIEKTLRAIDRANFRLIYEPANLELCAQDYGPGTLQRLSPWLANVYLQNQRLKPDGSVRLDTWCRGPVSFDIIPIHQPGGIDFERVFDGLRAVGYDATITVHQSTSEQGRAADEVAETATFLWRLMH